MANDKETNDTINAAKGLNSNIAEAQKMADFFFKEASKNTGKIKENLDKVGGIYSALAKNTAQQLEIERKIVELDEKRQKIYEEIDKLKKDDPKKSKDALDAKQKEVDKTNELIQKENEDLGVVKKRVEENKKVVGEINNQTTAMGKFFESGKAKLAAYLLSTERLMQ